MFAVYAFANPDLAENGSQDCWARNDFKLPIEPPAFDGVNEDGVPIPVGDIPPTWDTDIAVNATAKMQSYFTNMFIFSLLLLVS